MSLLRLQLLLRYPDCRKVRPEGLPEQRRRNSARRNSPGLSLNEPLTIVDEDCPVPLTRYVYAGSEANSCNPPPTMFIDANFREIVWPIRLFGYVNRPMDASSLANKVPGG